MAALADDGIPGGPGIYSTRCPPLPRLRMKESREVVHRATLKARGIDPDAAPPSRKGSRPTSKSGSRKGTPGDASGLFGDFDLGDLGNPLPKLNRLGGGGGGDFSSGVGADRYLKVSYEAKKLRETRKRELAKAGYSTGSPVKPGTSGGSGGDDGAAQEEPDTESVLSMLDDRAAEAEKAWNKARTEQQALLHTATQTFNTVTNKRREREATLGKLELEYAHLESTGVVDFSDLEGRVEKLKVDYTAQLEQSEEEAERKHPIYLQIANRLREGNLELKQGVENLKDVIKDVQADHDSCKEYERAALEAQKKGGEALEWIQARYIAKVEGWRTELEKTRKEREQLAEELKNERAEDREFKRRMEQRALEREAKKKSLKRLAAGMMHEVEVKEMEEEVSRGALSQLAITVGLDNPESCTPDEIVFALNNSREKKDKFAVQISALQEKEAELWKTIMKEKEALQQARLGLSARMQARLSQAGGPRMSMGMSRKSTSLGEGAGGEGAAAPVDPSQAIVGRTSRMSEAEVDLATTREGYMDELLLGKEKVLMSIFRNFNNAMVVLATFDEGLRSINDMMDTVIEAPKKKRAAMKNAQRAAQSPTAAGSQKDSLSRVSSTSNARDSMSDSFANRKVRMSTASSIGGMSPRTSENTNQEGGGGGGVSFADDVLSTTQEVEVDITPLTALFQAGGGGSGARSKDMMEYYERLPDLVEATLTRLMDIMRHVPREGRAARVSVTLGTPSVASGGKGIPLDHPLAGVGHKLGKVNSAVAEVDNDPAGLTKKKGTEYKEQMKKWCYEAGPPVESEDDEEDPSDNAGGSFGTTLGTRVQTKVQSVSQFKRIGNRGRNDPDAPMQVLKRGDLKQESDRAQAKIDKAKGPAIAAE